MATKEEDIERINRCDGQHVAVAIWSREDVFDVAERRDMKITEAQADAILDEMDRKQDCEVGITWDTLEFYLDQMVPA